MMLAFALSNLTPTMTAGASGAEVGFDSGSFGSVTGSPPLIRSRSSIVTQLIHSSSANELRIIMTGDQTSWVGAVALQVAGQTYEVSAASSGPTYFSGSDLTDIRWSEATSIFTNGNRYTYRFD